MLSSEFLTEMGLGLLNIFLYGGVAIILLLLVVMVWSRFSAKGKAYIHFIQETGYIVGETVKLGVNGDHNTFKSKKMGGEYITVGAEKRYINWPPGYPPMSQYPVPYYRYRVNDPNPLDAASEPLEMTANTLEKLRDEVFIRATWQDAREGADPDSKGNKVLLTARGWMLVFSGGALLLAGAATYYGYMIMQQLEIMRTLGAN